jgi:Xaa-Pro aminopeptidase
MKMLNSEMDLAFFVFVDSLLSPAYHKMKKIIFPYFFFAAFFAKGQQLQHYRYDSDLLTKEFHKDRREALRKQMPDSSVAVLFSAPERNRSNDNDFQYHQNPNFYYLTGLTEPNALLLVFKNDENIGGVQSNEILFVQDRDLEAESWTGRRLGAEGAKSLGFSVTYTDATFDTLQIPFKNFSKIFYLSLPKGIVNDKKDSADLYDLVEQFKKKADYPSDRGDDSQLAKWLAALREIKQPEEIVLMKKVITMSCDGHIEMMKAVEPGMTEYQAQAIGEYVFKKNGSEYVGYPSICGGGENSCILHYQSNRKKLVDGDLLLLDMGAEYHGYSADVTRTLPVNGKFSSEQKIIYELVFTAQEAGFKECKRGNEFQAPHKAATAVIKQGLLDLEIIKDEKDYKKYFSHGTSHYLGLDVHDAGTRDSLRPGTVITVEPGIYIPEGSPCDPKWWNIGVRIEDDILITDSGYENLSGKAPRSTGQIEELMRQKSMFNEEK